MSFADAAKTGLRKYFTFSGRAVRSEYWWFVLFTVLVGACASLIDTIIYGDDLIRTDIIDEQTYATYRTTGPVAALVSLVTFIPLLSAGWRRMHDTGRSGLLLLIPVVVIVAFGGWALAIGMDRLSFALVTVLAAGVVVFFVSLLLLLWWLIGPTQPGPNKYGPNSHEVSQ